MPSSGRVSVPRCLFYARLYLFVTMSPDREIEKDEAFRKGKHDLILDICRDVRVRTKIQGYINTTASKSKGDAAFDKKEFAKGVYTELNRAVDDIITAELKLDAGYDRQYRVQAAETLLMELMAQGSQHANQRQSQRDLLRSGHHELSRTARGEKRKQRESGWTFEQ